MVAMLSTPVIVGGAAAAIYLFNRAQEEGRTAVAAPQPTKGANMSSPLGLKMSGFSFVGGNGKGATSGLVTSGGGSWTEQADVAAKQKLKELEQQAKSKYNELSAAAKKKAVETLNKLNPSPGLTGKETWEEASKKVGAALGGVVGIAACNAIPVPGLSAIAATTVCATLGAMIGAYLGERLGKWAKQAYQSVKAWSDRQWDKLKSTIGDKADAIKRAADKAWDTVKFW